MAHFGGAAAIWKSPAIRAALPPFIATRPLVLALGLAGLAVFGYTQGGPPFRAAASEVWNLPARWDAGWYLGIASDGYSQQTHRGQNVAFFPLFPMLMRAGGMLLGSHRVMPSTFEASAAVKMLTAGVAISLGAFLAAMVFLYRLAREDLDEEQSRASLLLTASYPFAVFFSAPYTESLFLLTAVATFYYFRRGRPLPAAMWGFATGLTRPNGCFLSVPLALMLLGRLWPQLRRGAVSAGEVPVAGVPNRWRRNVGLAAAAAMPGIAMLMYSAYVWQLTGRPFSWVEVQAGWGRVYGIPFIWEYKYVSQYGLYDYTVTQPLNLLNTVASLAAIALIWPVTRRLGVAYGAFVALNIIPTLTTGMLGTGRYTAVLFPNFLFLGLTMSGTGRTGLATAFAVLQGLAAILFFTWRTMI
jgi:hypothetical protein